MTAKINTVNLERFKDTALFSIKLKKGFGNRAQIKDAAALEQYLEALNAPGDDEAAPAVEGITAASAKALKSGKRISATKRLIDCPALAELSRKMTEAKNLCLARSMPSFFRSGMFVVRLSEVANVEKILTAAVQELELVHVPNFLEEYPAAIEQARTLPVKRGGLGCLFDANDYPAQERLAGAFSIEWNWLALGVPEGLPEELRASEAAKLQTRFAEAAEDIQNALRVMFADLVDTAKERLTPGADGKQKVFRDSLVGNLREFCDTFNAKNIMDDKELGAIVEKAKAIFEGIAPDDLRKKADIRNATTKALDEIKAQLDPIVKPARAMDFED